MSEKDKSTDAEIFVPETRMVVIGGRDFQIDKFTLEQWIKITRELTTFGSALFLAVKKDRPDLSLDNLEKIKMEEVLPYVWTELHRIVPILAMALEGVDSTWLKKQHDMEGISSLFKAICELNNFKVIFANFTGAFQTLVAQWKEAVAKESVEEVSE